MRRLMGFNSYEEDICVLALEYSSRPKADRLCRYASELFDYFLCMRLFGNIYMRGHHLLAMLVCDWHFIQTVLLKHLEVNDT